MWAAVRPGGLLVAEDADFYGSFCEPLNAGFDFGLRTYCAALERPGGDPAIARKLFGHFTAAGIPITACSRSGRGERKGIDHGHSLGDRTGIRYAVPGRFGVAACPCLTCLTNPCRHPPTWR